MSALAGFVSKAVTAISDNEGPGTADKIRELNMMVEKYSSSFAAHKISKETPGLGRGDVVLLTGSTGSFGCNILAQLAASDSVIRIYALNRRSAQGQTLLERQRDTLRTGGHDGDILGLPKLRLIEADLSVSGFDIDSGLYDEVSPFLVVEVDLSHSWTM